jgi:hypothetical protein
MRLATRRGRERPGHAGGAESEQRPGRGLGDEYSPAGGRHANRGKGVASGKESAVPRRRGKDWEHCANAVGVNFTTPLLAG